ncbi:MFS transporter [Parabacteroides sp. Marseille-P3160]|uniref:MFS transporter n=1 Tax=Parabacteroides sp. Marseille-P3160 TaxID=1917887 RepID=UPI0009BC72FA|nr:MFS transporter [Parabacteroides sp. Marseille-P3160]
MGYERVDVDVKIEAVRPKLWTASFWNVCISNFLMACSFNLLMPSIPLYITEVLYIPQTKTGVILASYALALMFVRPFSGYFVDLHSRKKTLLIGFACYVLVFLGYFHLSSQAVYRFAHSVLNAPWTIYAVTIGVFIFVRFLHGITWGISTVSSSTLAIDVVPSARRAEGIGYYGTFMNVAMAIGPFLAIHIYQTYGFERLLFCAIGMGLLGVFSVSLIKAPERPKGEKGKLSFDRFFLTGAWPIFLNQLLLCFSWGTIGPFVAQYGKQIDIKNPGIFFLFWASGIMISRVFSGKLVDRGYIHHVNQVAMGIAVIAFCGFALIHNIFYFCLSGLAIGIAFGMMFPALQTLYINMAPNNRRGTANSTYLLGFDLGLALGMLVGGYITGIFSFESLYLVDSSLCLLGILYYTVISRPLYERKRLR